MIPQAVFGIDDSRSVGARKGSHDQLPERGRVGKVEMDDVVAPGQQLPAQGGHPAEVRVVRGTEGVHRRPARPDRRYQGILLPQDVGHLVGEAGSCPPSPPCPPTGVPRPRSPDT